MQESLERGIRWDVFCHVVDYLGDIGVCWRLACDLAARGQRVRLWIDDASALRWIAPQGHPGVTVLPWQDAANAKGCGDVVIEAFGCEIPAAFQRTMARSATPPVWINLEHLSAEGFVARTHGLRSPQLSGPAAGLTKWFFYPGFAAPSGGLLRETDLAARQARFDASAWRAALSLPLRAGERSVSLFCYQNAALDALLDALSAQPTLLLATQGEAARQVGQSLGPALQRGSLRAHLLPALTQLEFDHLLWSCDLNLVRGEDSWVRAQWAQAPFVWQAYVQRDSAHHAKVQAFLDLYLVGAGPELAAALRRLWAAWNGMATAPVELPEPRAWAQHQQRWRETLQRQPDLTSQLMAFAHARR